MIGRTLAVVAACLAASANAYSAVTISGDSAYPNGICGGSGCNLRGAWENAMNGTDPIIAFQLQSTSILGPLIGRSGMKVTISGNSNGNNDLPTISMDDSLQMHHSEFIRWLDFDSSSFLSLNKLNIYDFFLNEPSGPPVEEYGAAINLGCVPQQDGSPRSPCHQLSGSALPQPNIEFKDVNFTKNFFISSSPPIDAAYGAAVALRCSSCYAAFTNVNFVRNSAAINGPARGILFTNIARYEPTNVNYIDNQDGDGGNTYICQN